MVIDNLVFLPIIIIHIILGVLCFVYASKVDTNKHPTLYNLSKYLNVKGIIHLSIVILGIVFRFQALDDYFIVGKVMYILVGLIDAGIAGYSFKLYIDLLGLPSDKNKIKYTDLPCTSISVLLWSSLFSIFTSFDYIIHIIDLTSSILN